MASANLHSTTALIMKNLLLCWPAKANRPCNICCYLRPQRIKFDFFEKIAEVEANLLSVFNVLFVLPMPLLYLLYSHYLICCFVYVYWFSDYASAIGYFFIYCTELCLSFFRVPLPIMIASFFNLILCANTLAAADVIHLL